MMSTRFAANPKDYVYGGIGLLQNEIKQKVLVDYTATDASVFASAVKLAFDEADGVLMDLGMLWRDWEGVSKVVPDLPSWCPDFSNSVHDSKARAFCASELASFAVRSKCESLAWVEFRDEARVLGFRALRLDKVAKTVESALHHNAGIALSTEDSDELYEMLFLSSYRDMLTGWLNAILEDLATELDKLVKGNTNPADESQPFRLTALRLQSHCERLQLESIRTIDQAMQRLEVSRNGIAALGNDVARLVRHHNGRYYFRTSSRRIGCAPLPLDEGCHIILVPTARTLHVLSPDCDQYVTTCYVNGYMGGSLLNMGNEFEKRWETFWIT